MNNVGVRRDATVTVLMHIVRRARAAALRDQRKRWVLLHAIMGACNNGGMCCVCVCVCLCVGGGGAFQKNDVFAYV